MLGLLRIVSRKGNICPPKIAPLSEEKVPTFTYKFILKVSVFSVSRKNVVLSCVGLSYNLGLVPVCIDLFDHQTDRQIALLKLK